MRRVFSVSGQHHIVRGLIRELYVIWKSGKGLFIVHLTLVITLYLRFVWTRGRCEAGNVRGLSVYEYLLFHSLVVDKRCIRAVYS